MNQANQANINEKWSVVVLSLLVVAIGSIMRGKVALAQQSFEWFPYIGLKSDREFRVVQIEDNSPAQHANLQPGDQIVTIDGQQIKVLSYEKAVSRMRGALGTQSELIVSRHSKLYTVKLTRAADWRTSPNTASHIAISPPLVTSPHPIVHPSAAPISIAKVNDLDKRLVVIRRHTELTDGCYQSVMHALSLLSPTVERFFADHGVTVVITPTLADIGMGDGRSEYSPSRKQVIICERNTDATSADLLRLHINTLHELGHAYDQLLNYPSRSSVFAETYESEARNIDPKQHPQIVYFLQPGENGPRECFASLFACRYYQGDDERLTDLRKNFPKSFAFVCRLPEQ